MRLVVDALAARKGGTAYAAARLARAVADHEAVEQVVVITRERSIVASEIGPQPGAALQLELLSAVPRVELPRRIAWEAARLPGLLRRRGATHLLSWSGMLPRAVEIPVLCHVSNALMFESPGRFDGIRCRAMARTARFGARFATPTKAMGDLVMAAIGTSPAVIPYGVDAAAFFPGERAGTDIICVADFYPHKRHDLLLDAWAGLESPRPPLRLLGDPTVDPDWHGAIVDRAAAIEQLGQIHIQSGLDAAAMGAAYRESAVCVVASAHESFGLPLLEAQACGLATVARDLPTLRETGGPSTVFVAGDHAHEWTLAIQRALESANELNVREAVAGHAAGFTWEKAASGTVELLTNPR